MKDASGLIQAVRPEFSTRRVDPLLGERAHSKSRSHVRDGGITRSSALMSFCARRRKAARRC